MKIVITSIQFDPFTKKPVMVMITIFNQMGVEQFRTSLPARMFKGELTVGTELVFTANN